MDIVNVVRSDTLKSLELIEAQLIVEILKCDKVGHVGYADYLRMYLSIIKKASKNISKY